MIVDIMAQIPNSQTHFSQSVQSEAIPDGASDIPIDLSKPKSPSLVQSTTSSNINNNNSHLRRRRRRRHQQPQQQQQQQSPNLQQDNDNDDDVVFLETVLKSVPKLPTPPPQLDQQQDTANAESIKNTVSSNVHTSNSDRVHKAPIEYYELDNIDRNSALYRDVVGILKKHDKDYPVSNSRCPKVIGVFPYYDKSSSLCNSSRQAKANFREKAESVQSSPVPSSSVYGGEVRRDNRGQEDRRKRYHNSIDSVSDQMTLHTSKRRRSSIEPSFVATNRSWSEMEGRSSCPGSTNTNFGIANNTTPEHAIQPINSSNEIKKPKRKGKQAMTYADMKETRSELVLKMLRYNAYAGCGLLVSSDNVFETLEQFDNINVKMGIVPNKREQKLTKKLYKCALRMIQDQQQQQPPIIEQDSVDEFTFPGTLQNSVPILSPFPQLDKQPDTTDNAQSIMNNVASNVNISNHDRVHRGPIVDTEWNNVDRNCFLNRTVEHIPNKNNKEYDVSNRRSRRCKVIGVFPTIYDSSRCSRNINTQAKAVFPANLEGESESVQPSPASSSKVCGDKMKRDNRNHEVRRKRYLDSSEPGTSQMVMHRSEQSRTSMQPSSETVNDTLSEADGRSLLPKRTKTKTNIANTPDQQHAIQPINLCTAVRATKTNHDKQTMSYADMEQTRNQLVRTLESWYSRSAVNGLSVSPDMVFNTLRQLARLNVPLGIVPNETEKYFVGRLVEDAIRVMNSNKYSKENTTINSSCGDDNNSNHLHYDHHNQDQQQQHQQSTSLTANENPTNSTSTHPNQCPSCKGIFSTVDSMSRHYRFVHLGWAPFYCKLAKCDFKTGYSSVIIKHVKRHFDSNTSSELRVHDYYGTRGEDQPPTDARLSAHLLKTTGAICPVPSIEQIWRECKCSQCGRTFPRQLELESHLKSHRKNGYRCIWPSCSYFYSDLMQAQLHICFDHFRTPAQPENMKEAEKYCKKE